MPPFLMAITQAAPTAQFVSASQAILFRGAGVKVAWPQMLALIFIGSILFSLSFGALRKTIGQLA